MHNDAVDGALTVEEYGDAALQYNSPGRMLSTHSRFSQFWDGFIAGMLMYFALAVPVEVAFLDVRNFSALWFIGRAIDLVRSILRPCRLAPLACTAQRYVVSAHRYSQWIWS
jgi:hypothetical protein